MAGDATFSSDLRCRAIQVNVIGDSLSTGVNRSGNPWTSDAQRLLAADGRDVHIVDAAENGAGYAATGANGSVFRDLVDRVVDDRSQVVVVFGSDNDVGQPDLAAAIAGTLDRIRTLAPRARLIVVGPPAPPADAPQQLQGVRDALQAVTGHVDGQFVDPLALKWFQGGDSRYVGPDGEHPSAAGEVYLARKMTAILAAETPACALTGNR